MVFRTTLNFTTERSLAGCTWHIPGKQQQCRAALQTVLIYLAPGSHTWEAVSLEKFSKTMIASSERRESKSLQTLFRKNVARRSLNPGATFCTMISSSQWWGTLEKVAAFSSGIMNLGCPKLSWVLLLKEVIYPRVRLAYLCGKQQKYDLLNTSKGLANYCRPHSSNYFYQKL